MEGENRHACRRAQHPCQADLRPDEAIQERRLPGPGRAADDDECRRIHLREPREEIVVHLGDQVVPRAPRLVRPGHRQVEADGGKIVPQAAELVGQIGSHVR
jgi:hypothetical protein